MSASALFFNCEVQRALRTVGYPENIMTPRTSTLQDAASDFLRSSLRDHLEFRHMPLDYAERQLVRVEGRVKVALVLVRVWPIHLVCYHCGGVDGCQRDPTKELQYSIVMPQCSQCRLDQVEPYFRRPVQNKAANVISERHKAGAAAALADHRAAEHAANPAPERNDVGCDRVNQIVGARTDAHGNVDYFVHWAKLNGVEYPPDTCTWEERSAAGVKDSNLDEEFLVQMPMHYSTAKRCNEGFITEYDPATKKFKIEYESGQELLKNLHKPDRNHSWELNGYDENEEDASAAGEAADDSSESASTSDDSADEADEVEHAASSTQELIQPPSDSE